MNDAGKVAFTPKGDYSSTVTYEYLDTVVYNGNAYAALKTTTGNAPTDSDTDENWKLLARGGTSVPIATEKIAGVVKAGSDVGVSDTGDMVLKTDFTEQKELAELTSGENRSTFFGKIAKAVADFISHKSTRASTTDYGHTILEDSIDSTSTNKAATSASVKKAYDLANAAVPTANISQSSAITETGTYVLDAAEKNASVEGTIAHDIAELNSNLVSINSNLNSEIGRAKEADEILKSRVDIITSLSEGSTTGDAELHDIRVKADGSTATSAGNAVREQVSELKGDLSELRTNYINLFNIEAITHSKMISESGEILDGAGLYDISDFIKTDGYFRVSYESTGNPIFRIAFYDENKDFVQRIDFLQEERTFRREWNGYIRVVLFTSMNEQQQMDYNTIMISHGGDIVPYSPYYTANDKYAREKVEKLDKLSKKDKIAMFGDSITWGTCTGGRTDKGLPYWVNKVTGCIADNYGVGSQGWVTTSPDGNVAIDNIQNVDLSGYEIVTLQYGINDSNAYLGTYTDTTNDTIMGAMYQAVKYLYDTYPNIKVVIIAPTNTTNKGYAPRWRLDASMLRGYTGQQMIDEYKKFADYYCIPIITYEHCPANTFNIANLLCDTVHPNENGYKMYGNYLGNELKKYLN